MKVRFAAFIFTICSVTAIMLAGCKPPADTPNPDPAPDVITFVTEGSTFAPVLVLSGPADVLWTWSTGAVSTSTEPSVDFGSGARRSHTLSVTPWSAVRRINVGYDAGDGGSRIIEFVPDQHVSAVKNLSLVAPYLVEWCSSYNNFSSLDFSDFTALQTIECYLSESLTSVNLRNTPKLRRACFEDCSLSTLDLSESPALEDLRGALNNYRTIHFGTTGAAVWHICVRDNEQMTNRTLFSDMDQFPEIAELFIWKDNQTGALAIPSTSSNRDVSIQASWNSYTSLNLRGALKNPAMEGIVELRGNPLAAVDITGCTQINVLNLYGNNLSSAELDGLLGVLDGLGRSAANSPSGMTLLCDVRGTSGISEAGIEHAEKLAEKGWTVYTNGREFHPAMTASGLTFRFPVQKITLRSFNRKIDNGKFEPFIDHL